MVDRFTPRARVEIDGADVTRPIWQYLNTLTYEDAEKDDADSLEIKVSNAPAFAMPPHGGLVCLWMGYKEDKMRFMGSFEIDETSVDLNPATMTIHARSAMFSTGVEKQKEDVEWENLTLVDLATKIGERHGLKAKVTVDIFYDAVAQTQESDLHFLRRLAEELNASFAIKDKTILIFPPSEASRPHAGIMYSEACKGGFRVADRGKYGKVEAKWWCRKDLEEKSIVVGDGEGATYTIKRSFKNEAEAKAAVENKNELLKRGMMEGDLTLPGDPSLVAGAELLLSGFKPDVINGLYLGTKVKQSMSKTAWTTQVALERLPE